MPQRARGGPTAPPQPGARYRVLAEVVESASLPGEHHRLSLRAPEIVAQAGPGQFLQIWCHRPEDLAQPPAAAVLRRPLSISRLRPPDHLELLLRVRGVGGTILSRKAVGDVLDVIGPLGHGFEIPEGLPMGVIVAGGIGLAPTLILAEALVSRGVRTVILAGASDDRRMPFPVIRAEGRAPTVPALESLGAQVEYSSEAVEGRLVGELLAARLEEFCAAGAGCYAVGPRAMLRHIVGIVDGRLPLQVSLEERMACGVGACRSCVVPVLGKDGPGFLTACREGPVFAASQVDWERLSDVGP